MFKNIALVLLGGCSFGILSTFVKLAYAHGFSLADVTSAQAYFGAVILWLLLLMYRIFFAGKYAGRRSAAVTPFARQRALRFLILTGMASGSISICYYKCVSLVPASIAIILLMQYTWISMLLERLIFKRKLGLQQLGCLLLILVGTVLGSGIIGSQPGVHLEMEGIGFGLLAAFFYAVFLLSNGYVGNHLAPVQKSSWIVLGVCLIIMVVFPPFKTLYHLYHSGHALGAYLAAVWPWGLLLGFFGMVLPPLLFAIAIPRTGVALGSILGAIELPTAAICACYVLHEPVGWLQIMGILLILLSIVLINLKARQPSKPAVAAADHP